MNVLVRMARSLPLVAVLALLAVAVYVVVSWRRSPNQAKETLIRLFTVLTGIVLFSFVGILFFNRTKFIAWAHEVKNRHTQKAGA